MAEHRSPKPGAAGSIPVSPAITTIWWYVTANSQDSSLLGNRWRPFQGARGKSGLALPVSGKKVGAQRKLWQGDLTAANLSLWDTSSYKSSTETSHRGNTADETRKAPPASNANYGSGTPSGAEISLTSEIDGCLK